MKPLGATLLVALALATPAAAFFEVVVTDSTIGLVTTSPTIGSTVVGFSTVDGLTFTNGLSLERALWTQTVALTFTKDDDASTSTTTVSHQGTTTSLANVVYGAQSAVGNFAPFRLTGSDLTGEAGWTANAGCAAVVYQGSLAVPSYTSLGAPRSTATYYYQVCDSSEEIYVGASKNLGSADFAYVSSKATTALTGESDYEIVLESVDFVFTSAASAAAVRLDQGTFVPITSTTATTYLLYRWPDGFPAGTLGVTVTTAASDITI